MKTLAITLDSDIFEDSYYSDEFCLYAYKNNISAYNCTCANREKFHVLITVPNNLIIIFLMKYNVKMLEMTEFCSIYKYFKINLEFMVSDINRA